MSHDNKVTYDDKVSELASSIQPHVLFDSVEQASEYITAYKQPEGSDIRLRIQLLSQTLFNCDERLEVAEALDKIGTAYATKLSALREAIVICAQRFIDRHKLDELAALGDIDRRPDLEAALSA